MDILFNLETFILRDSLSQKLFTGNGNILFLSLQQITTSLCQQPFSLEAFTMVKLLYTCCLTKSSEL